MVRNMTMPTPTPNSGGGSSGSVVAVTLTMLFLLGMAGASVGLLCIGAPLNPCLTKRTLSTLVVVCYCCRGRLRPTPRYVVGTAAASSSASSSSSSNNAFVINNNVTPAQHPSMSSEQMRAIVRDEHERARMQAENERLRAQLAQSQGAMVQQSVPPQAVTRY